MVRLEKLVIQGFKSFKRKVSIPFPPGLSVIIGPNGAGKTNLVDAINFVIGRSSSRALRAKKASELIFHGSKKKTPSEYARVSLYFDNSDSALPFDEEVVTVSRTLNRNGISTYRLNGRIATRQQILDVLVQVGLRPDGFWIIQQGEVTRVVEMDAIERRRILDSLAGISEYEEKKAQAERELKATEERVKEAELILGEKQNILEKLREERAAALEWQKLQEELEQIKAACLIKERESLEKELAAIEEKIGQREEEQGGLAEKIEELDRKIREGEKQWKELSKRFTQLSQTLEAERELARLRAELNFKKSKLESNRQEIQRLRMLESRISGRPSAGFEGVEGVLGRVSDLLRVPPEYQIAFEAGVGGHLNDWIVENLDTAIKCIEILKKKKAGQVRFLPLDYLKPPARRPLPRGAKAWLSDIIQTKPKFRIVAEWLGNQTACVDDIYTAKEIAKIERVRMVTLDGDLFDASGSVTGGFYQRRRADLELGKQARELEEENRQLEKEIKQIESKLKKLEKSFRPTQELKVARIDESLARLRDERKRLYEKRLMLQQEIGRLNIQKARIEVKLDSLRLQIPEKQGENPFLNLDLDFLRRRETEVRQRIKELEPVNLRAIQDFEGIRQEFDKLKERLDKILAERESILQTISRIEERRKEAFMQVFEGVNRYFKETYRELTGGDAELRLEKDGDINSGLLIRASPPGKKLLNLDAMSTGEKTLTAFAFLFAIQRFKPAPFYLLDEADAALDAANSERIVKMMKKVSQDVQIIFISHNNIVIKGADQVYGVSMEDGESKVLAIKLPEN
ncbi:MAG: hypothetical protein DRP12_02010 [Candidatus Aenigmatarchaeota archaeon]|nr:MAG: hypothetical protein DRP12_02010 [Candidatus Aenigmarchaeota archaeon]